MAAGALPYRKILDTTGASVQLSEDDLMALGARIRAYISVGRIGPLAIVAATEHSYGQARMFTALAVADRPVRISSGSKSPANRSTSPPSPADAIRCRRSCRRGPCLGEARGA